jgi:methyl-accepting chemotaxis protein
MNGSKTVIILIIVFVVALFLGFLMGSKRVSDVRRELTELKTEWESQSATLKAERAKALAQKELAMCKWELVQTQTHASRRDFGKATEAFNAARDAFARSLDAASEEAKDFHKSITGLSQGFEEIQVGLDSNDVKITGRLAELTNHIDLLLSP